MSYMERIVSLYLDYAELQAERQIPMSMEDWAKRLDGFLEFNGSIVLYKTEYLCLIMISFWLNWKKNQSRFIELK